MSIKFAIKNTAGKAEREGDSIVRYTGVSEPFRRNSERDSKGVEVDKDGNTTRWKFVTGLEPEQVKFFKWYKSEDDKKVLSETISELTPLIEDFYGGKDIISPYNYHFWKKNRDVNRLSLTNEDIDVFYDTDKPAHALLYLSIAAGAFMDLVAPTKDWADSHQLPHYMVLETDADDVNEQGDDVTKSDAHFALGELKKEYGKDALFILAWCLQYETSGYGAYNRSTSERDLVNYHIKYIDGKIVTKRKKNCAKNFLDYSEKWKGQQTRPQVYAEAYIKAGQYYNFISQRDKKFVTADGTILGNTIQEAVTNIMKPKFTQDLEALKEKVEKKWSE